MFGPHFRDFSLKTCKNIPLKISNYRPKYICNQFKTPWKHSKMTICILCRSYIWVEVTSDDDTFIDWINRLCHVKISNHNGLSPIMLCPLFRPEVRFICRYNTQLNLVLCCNIHTQKFYIIARKMDICDDAKKFHVIKAENKSKYPFRILQLCC